MKNIIILFCICIVIFSCKKDKPFTPIDFTFNFTEPTTYSTDTLDCTNPGIILAANIYELPLFNPLNPNEIAFLHRPNNRPNFQLWTFNLKSGRKTKVTSKTVIAMDWGIDNWIVFKSSNNEFWQIKADGSELTKIPLNSSFTQFIKFSSNAKKIIFNRPASLSFGTDKLIFDIESQEVETLPLLEFKYFQTIDWKNNLLLFAEFNKIETYNLQSNQITKVDSIDAITINEQIINAQFTMDNDIFWLTREAIYKTNQVTGERTTIKTFGPDEDVNYMDISLDKKTILLQKIDDFILNNCYIQRRNYLAFIDIEGSNERKILIPN